jgi:hypothetical protein
MIKSTTNLKMFGKECTCGFGCGWLDGMGAEEALDLARTKLSELLDEPFQVQSLANSGHIFTARIQDLDGNLINQLSIDKQTGDIRFNQGPLKVNQSGEHSAELMEISGDRGECLPDSCEC